jgi:putative transposase
VSDYRRLYIPGGCCFFTVVTYHRLPVLAQPEHINALREAFRAVKAAHPFEVQAMVVLPDHLHCLWHLPEGDAGFSTRWRDIKNRVSRQIQTPINSRREKAVWQRRFWEHAIRDQDDWVRHVDYIHWNPVKHGYVPSPGDWPYSSFAQALRKGWYPPDWGRVEPAGIDGLVPE